MFFYNLDNVVLLIYYKQGVSIKKFKFEYKDKELRQQNNTSIQGSLLHDQERNKYGLMI